MPAWVIDKDIWKKAIGFFMRQHGRKPADKDWGIIAGIYKKLGGRKAAPKVTKENYNEVFNTIYEEYIQ